MPHCVIEYSSPLENQVSEKQLMDLVFEGAVNSQLFDVNSIKCRVIGYQSYLSKAEESDFIHITIRILAGRTIEQKSTLSQYVIQNLAGIGLKDISMTVDICDIETQCYAKLIT